MMAVCFGKGKNICILKLIKTAIIYLFLNEAIYLCVCFSFEEENGRPLVSWSGEFDMTLRLSLMGC